MKAKNNKTAKISKKMSFSEIMQKFPEVIGTLMEKGMHCCGCPMAMQETLEQGCLSHGINPDEVVKELNELLKKKK